VVAGDTTDYGQARTADKQTTGQPVTSPGPNPANRTPPKRRSVASPDAPRTGRCDRQPTPGRQEHAPGLPTRSQKEQTRCTTVPALCQRCVGLLAARRPSWSLWVVLTASSIGSAKGVGYARYLESKTIEPDRGDYYLNPEGEPTQAPGRWLSSSATLARLGIDDPVVNGPDFVALMEGQHPRTGGWLRAAGPNSSRGGGVDLTFSAPKSVSAVWAIGNRTQRQDMEAAHAAAVESALAYVRGNVATVRRRVGGRLMEETARDLIAAEYRHTVSRGVLAGDAPDPQLHSHVVVSAAVRDDERVVAVASRPLFRAAREVGAYYRLALASELADRGYLIDAGTGRHGRYFEIAGVPRKLAEAFSARSNEVARAAERFRAKWGREPERGELRRLKLENRAAKPVRTRSDLQRTWNETARHFDVSPSELTRLLLSAKGSLREQTLEDRVEHRLTDHAATFERRDFRAVLFEQAVGELSPSGALEAADRMLADGEIVPLAGGLMTTRAIRDRERAIERCVISLAARHGRDVGERARREATDEVVERIGAPLSSDQGEALAIATGPESAVVLIGPAGTGKGVVIDAAARAEQISGHETFGVAVSGSTAQRLGRDSPALLGRTMTLDALVVRAASGRLPVDHNTTIYFDEAGMVDTNRLDRLTEVLASSGAKLVAIGDGAQLPSIGAGGMFDRLAVIAPCAELTTVHRTRDPSEQRAWADLRAGRSDRAIAHYLANGRLHMSDSRDEALEAAVSDWARLTDGHAIAEVALISDASNKEIARLNARAQHHRIERGELGGLELDVPGTHYGIRSGDRIAMIDQHYEPGEQRIENGSMGVVLNVTADGEAEVEFDVTGQKRVLRGEDLSRLRLAYAQHIHRAQGATVRRTLVITGGWQTSKEPAYVEASRAREGTDWYVNRRELGLEGQDPGRIERFAAAMRRSRQQTPSLAHGDVAIEIDERPRDRGRLRTDRQRELDDRGRAR